MALGTSNVYEVFKSTGGTYGDLKEIAEVAMGKLQKAYESGNPVWKPARMPLVRPSTPQPEEE